MKMHDDLDGVTGTVGGNGRDFDDDPEYGGPAGEESEAKVRGQLVAASEFAVVSLVGASARWSRTKNTPSARIGVKVEEHFDMDAIGEVVWDDRYLSVSKTSRTDEKDEDGRFIEEPKSAAKLAEDVDGFKAMQNRIGRVLGLANSRPASKGEDAINAYVGQYDAVKGVKFIIPIRIQKDYQGNPQNRLAWEGMRALTDKAVNKKLRGAGKTAYDEALMEFAKRTQKGGKPTTAAALKRTEGAIA
jgi:hypothetical protein